MDVLELWGAEYCFNAAAGMCTWLKDAFFISISFYSILAEKKAYKRMQVTVDNQQTRENVGVKVLGHMV